MPSQAPSPTAPRLACLDDFELLEIVEGTSSAEALRSRLEHADDCVHCRDLLADLMPQGASADSLEEQTVDHYRLGPLLAEGGMGRVYRAVDLDLDRAVAIKVPRSNSPALRQRFEREISISVRLAHPGVVPIHGTGKLSDGTPFYVMRFVDGDSLDIVQTRTTTTAERLALLGILVSVADTMAYVHSLGIAHRDLKPSNVLVGRFGEIVIIDWGLAKELAAPHSDVQTESSIETSPVQDPTTGATPLEFATHAGDIFGTPAFMAPEQINGHIVDQRTDVYALGVMLWNLLAGRIPRPDSTLDQESLPDVPPALVVVARRAMAIDRDARYIDAAAFADALRAAIHAPARPSLPTRRRSRVPVVAGAIIVAAAASAFAWWARAPRHARATTPSLPEPATLDLIDKDLSGDTNIALSPSGNRMAVGRPDRLSVRDFRSGQTWSSVNVIEWPATLQFDGENTLLFGEKHSFDSHSQLARWNLDTGQLTELPIGSSGRTEVTCGHLDRGDLFLSYSFPDRHLFIRDGSGVIPINVGAHAMLNNIAIAPTRKRFAFVEGGNYQGVISVVDSSGSGKISSNTMSAPTALTWFDDNTLLYAAKSSDENASSLFTVTATGDGLLHPKEIYRYAVPDQWISSLASGGGRVIALLAKSSFQTSLIDNVDKPGQTNLDINTAAAPLVWIDSKSFWTWNRGTHHIELHHVDRTPATISPIQLDGDPANATRAGDILIVALRASDGRRVEAYSLSDATLRWQQQPGTLLFVRCAGDVAPPCIAGQQVGDVQIELRRIDFATGALGDVVVPASNIDDAAVSFDGTVVAWIPSDATLTTRKLEGDAPFVHRTADLRQASTAHSIAYTATGTIMTSRMHSDREIVAITPDDRVERITHSEANIFSLIRPSPDGTHLLYRSRSFGTDLANIHVNGQSR